MKQLGRIISRHIQSQRSLTIGGTTVLAIAGTILLNSGHATTPTASIEPENGTLTSCASVTSDATASSGKAVKFCGAASDTLVTKVLTIFEENHSYAQSNSQMPYLDSLAAQYGYASNYHAITHPSLPNYLAVAAGSTFGETSDCTVAVCPQTGQNVFDQAIAAGETAKVYSEDMPSNCATTDSGLYAVRHTAWPYFTDSTSRANCNSNEVPAGTYQSGNFKNDVSSGSLPTVGWLTPNLCNDAHNSGCTLTGADNWLKNMLPMIMSGADWKSGHLAVVVTADEDDSASGNQVLTVVLHPSLQGKVVTTALDHYSLARFQEQVAGTSYLNNAASAADMAAAFGLSVSGDASVPFTFASLPDTQRDLWNTTSIQNNFNGRFNYLVANKDSLNLKYVWQVGDLEDTDNLLCAVGTPANQQSTCSHDTAVNPRYEPNPPFNIDHFQYYWASQGIKILENAHIPISLTVGNHDTGAVCGGPACATVAGQTQSVPVEVRNTSTFNTYEPPSRFGLANTQGTNTTDTSGVFEPNKSDNAYRTLQAGGLNWLIINLELWPRSSVIDWANAVATSHPHYNIIMTTHSYLDGGGNIDQSNGGYGTNTMQYVYDNFVKLHANMRFVFSGHVGNSDYRVDTGVNGNKIYDMMDTYHDTTNNWIRLITVNVQAGTVSTRVYAPLTNQTRTEAQANVAITGINWVR